MNFDFGDFAITMEMGKDAIGRNAFCIGQTGSGKTVAIQHIVNCLPRVIQCHVYNFLGWCGLDNVTSTTDAEHMTLTEVLEQVKTLRAENNTMGGKEAPMVVIICGVDGKLSPCKQLIKECNEMNVWFIFDQYQLKADFVAQLEDICEYQVYMRMPDYIADGLLEEGHRVPQPYGYMCMRKAGDSLHTVQLRVDYTDLTVSDNSFTVLT